MILLTYDFNTTINFWLISIVNTYIPSVLQFQDRSSTFH